MRMVVGCKRVHAGTQPLNIQRGPSVLNLHRVSPSVQKRGNAYDCAITLRLEELPGPEAFMMRDLRTSAGEQTVVATVPFGSQ